jgi:hypothetical protein
VIKTNKLKLNRYKRITKIFKKSYFSLYLLKEFIINNVISDKKFAELRYKKVLGKSLDLKNPKTFNEKLWWLNLNNKDPLMTICSDKVEVRKYLKDLGMEDLLIENFGIYNDARDVEFNKITSKAIIKCSHGSGTNILYDPTKPFDRKKFIKVFNSALKKNYYKKSREWNYKNIEPKLIVEKIIGDSEEPLIDYRFMCFNGKAEIVLVDIDTMAEDGSHARGAKRNVYDKKFNYLDMKIGRENYDENLVDKPQNYDKMIEYAEQLSKPFVHCRVDLYNVKGKIYFGEITFYSGGAIQEISPNEWDYQLGSWVNLNKIKK